MIAQLAHPCGVHDDCTVIGLYTDVAPEGRDFEWSHSDHGHIIWQSHAHRDTHIACRLGDQLPTCIDHEGKRHQKAERCVDCHAYFGTSEPLDA